jgi:Caudovirus prohead serine protease
VVAARSDVYELCQRGDLSSSFAFLCTSDSWSHREGYPVRTLHSVALKDVSAVSSPAYLDADVGLRSLANFVHAPYEDVTRYAQTGSLSKFFTRTDRPNHRGKRSLTYQQREVELMRMRWGPKPLTPQQEAVESVRHKTIHQKVAETYAMDPAWLE